MEQTTKPSMDAGTKPDRTLAITCTPVLNWVSSTPPYNIGASATYSYNENGSNPDMTDRVHSDGDILLHPLPDPQDFNNNVDITITLDTSRMVDPNNNPVAGRWALDGEYNGPCWFCAVQNVARREYDTTPITIPGMTTSRLGDTQVLIDDDTPMNAPNYAYCLGLVLPAYSNYFITLDPILTNKTGGTNPPFMLKD